MRPPPLAARRRLGLTLALLALAGPARAASSCDEIRTSIDAKIRAAGVQRYTLEVLDAQARSGVKVVGTCELGARKIVYSKLAATPAASGASATRPQRAAPRDEALLTECRDGTASVGGDCPK